MTGLDQWYSDFVETDWRYVERFYQTGQIPPWEECVTTGCALIRAGVDPRIAASPGRGAVRLLIPAPADRPLASDSVD